MTERLLQYIWQFQHFNPAELVTEEGEAIKIIHPGSLNSNQGPDFCDAKIKIGKTTWAGSVEIHTRSSEWIRHKHSRDKNYRNVILHVVWENDRQLDLPFSTLVLQSKVPKLLLYKFDELMSSKQFIPCEGQIQQVGRLSWQSWKERLLVERLEQKNQEISDHQKINNNYWEETFWWLLAKNFGIKLNSGAFEKMAQSLPLRLLAKHTGQIHQIEALLFGQAGLLQNRFTEAYPKLLQKEYLFLKKKYGLAPTGAPLLFLRMRPSNFPTVRLAQLAKLIHSSHHLFTSIRETDDLKKVRSLFVVTANDYWHYHYVFEELSAFKKKTLGIQMINNIVINTVVPILFAYGHYHADQNCRDRAIEWLDQVTGEKNKITNGFRALGVKNNSAFDSQALIRLKNEYCNKKRCLDCRVGNALLKNESKKNSDSR